MKKETLEDTAAREVAAKVSSLFLGKRREATTPHRCLGCGRVTRHVFCPDTYEACRQLYRDRLA